MVERKEMNDKRKVLELVISQIEKQFGKGAIMRLGQEVKFDIEVIPTGAISLDIALGIGGMPRGRVIEVFGPEASGKTTLTYGVISEIQKRGGVAAFIDAEHAFDSTYAKKVGINLDELLISQPDTGEQALEIAETLVRSNAVDLIVIDSVAALVPRAEIEGEMGEAQVGLQARLMSQAMRKLTAAISKSKTCVIFINQIREKIGVFFGSPETTPGGRALKFYASVRIELRRIGSIKEGENIIGGRIKARIVKNKVAPPFKEAEFDILHDEGISKVGSIIEVGIEKEIVKKSGAWLFYKDEKLGQGINQARKFLKENPKILKELEEEVRGICLRDT
jgi:recombination protein RecA